MSGRFSCHYSIYHPPSYRSPHANQPHTSNLRTVGQFQRRFIAFSQIHHTISLTTPIDSIRCLSRFKKALPSIVHQKDLSSVRHQNQTSSVQHYQIISLSHGHFPSSHRPFALTTTSHFYFTHSLSLTPNSLKPVLSLARQPLQTLSLSHTQYARTQVLNATDRKWLGCSVAV